MISKPAPPSVDVQKLLLASSGRDLAAILGVPYDRLVYHLYKNAPSKRYVKYAVPKRAGGSRVILAPNSVLKRLQQSLLPYLAAMYTGKSSNHGFVVGRSVLTNAQLHVNRRYVVNLDLADFFPSINSRRIFGMLRHKRYGLHQEVAAFVTQLCTHEDVLPQGAPTSPILSNMICAPLDDQLQRLARSHACTYTRYADDITFSTNSIEVPDEILCYASVGDEQTILVGDALKQIVDRNGFEIQLKKFRLQHRTHRQVVTGILVNQRPNLPRAYKNRIRAMLHAWQVYGHSAAEQEFRAKFRTKHQPPFKEPPAFYAIVKGKLMYLQMVRGAADPIVVRFKEKYEQLYARDVKKNP